MSKIAPVLTELRPKILDNSTNEETEEFKKMTFLTKGNMKNALMGLEAIQTIANDCLSSKIKDAEFTKESVKEIFKKAEDVLKCIYPK